MTINRDGSHIGALHAITGVILGLAVLIVSSLVGCQSPFGTECTLIGCSSGLEIQFEDQPVVPYRVEADAGGSEARYVFECSDAEGCPRIFFSEFTPDWLVINVITGSDTTWYEVRPSYEQSQPNGPDCEPTCFNAVVQLPADALSSGD